MADSYKSSTIRRRANSLGRLSVFSHLPDPSKAPEVILALKRIHRKPGRACDLNESVQHLSLFQSWSAANGQKKTK